MLSQNTTSPRRSFPRILAVIFSLGIGVLAVLLAVGGLVGKGGVADRSTALPNLLTGIASIVGAGGYLALRKWAVPVYALAVLGHFVAHTLLYLSHHGSGRISIGGLVSLWMVPALALLVLLLMERDRRRGTLV